MTMRVGVPVSMGVRVAVDEVPVPVRMVMNMVVFVGVRMLMFVIVFDRVGRLRFVPVGMLVRKPFPVRHGRT
jgi:hypothetical protein